MRVIKYLIEKNIGLGTVKMLCDFLKLDSIEVNSKLTVEKKELIDKTLNSESFEKWYQIKLSLDCIEINESKSIIKTLYCNSVVQIDILLGERILNSLIHLIKNGFYGQHKESLLKIISSDISILDKINLLKLSKPFSEQETPSIKTKDTSKIPEDIDLDDSDEDTKHELRISRNDPYEGFRWGGLEGEEAYAGYWNTD